MTNNKLMTAVPVLVVALCLASAARAASSREACAALVEARSALWSMIDAKDASALDSLNERVQAASAKLDSVLAGMTGADAKAAGDFKVVWDQFKMTREAEIVPAIRKGNAKDAKNIAGGVQLDRLAKMWDIMSCKVR
jgi:hypothetical protein